MFRDTHALFLLFSYTLQQVTGLPILTNIDVTLFYLTALRNPPIFIVMVV